mgnify:FL=1
MGSKKFSHHFNEMCPIVDCNVSFTLSEVAVSMAIVVDINRYT